MPPVLTQEHADEVIESAKRLGVFSAMQATDVRRMQREMKEQHFLMERMLKFFCVCSGLVVCALAAMVGILIAVWGDQIQVAHYVSSPPHLIDSPRCCAACAGCAGSGEEESRGAGAEGGVRGQT